MRFAVYKGLGGGLGMMEVESYHRLGVETEALVEGRRAEQAKEGKPVDPVFQHPDPVCVFEAPDWEEAKKSFRASAKITHVAIRFQGVVWSLPAPNRHHDVLMHIVAKTGAESVDVPDEDEGFLDESGRYLTRNQALVSAFVHGQVKNPGRLYAGRTVADPDELYSEDLW